MVVLSGRTKSAVRSGRCLLSHRATQLFVHEQAAQTMVARLRAERAASLERIAERSVPSLCGCSLDVGCNARVVHLPVVTADPDNVVQGPLAAAGLPDRCTSDAYT